MVECKLEVPTKKLWREILHNGGTLFNEHGYNVFYLVGLLVRYFMVYSALSAKTIAFGLWPYVKLWNGNDEPPFEEDEFYRVVENQYNYEIVEVNKIRGNTNVVTGYTYDEIANMPSEKLEVIVDRLLCRNDRIVIGAPEKSGKSLIIECLAIQAARGDKVFGALDVPRPLKVAIIDTELRKSLRERLKRLVATLGTPSKNLLVIDETKLSTCDDKSFEALIATLKDFKPDLVIFDPLYRLVAESLKEDVVMKKCLDFFDRIIDELKCAVIIVHHTRKIGAPQFIPDNLSELFYGDSSIRWWCEVPIFVYRWRGSTNTSGALLGIHRNPDWNNVAHIFSYDKINWTTKLVEPEDAVLDERFKKMLADKYGVDFGEDTTYDYGAEIRKQVEKFNIKSAEWSRLANLPERSVQYWVKGERYPRVLEREKILEALRRIDELLKRELQKSEQTTKSEQ
ncbi:MAG: AAA family ATPase [Dehalococcoidales bacterium]|nr:AAA family ATPase [Dehalococcoidales bacterium]